MIKKMKIRTRMLFSYAVMTAVLLIASIVAISMLKQVGDSLNSFYNEQFHTVTQAWTARRAVYAARADMLQALVSQDKNAVQSSLDGAAEEAQNLQNAITQVRKTFDGDMSILDQVDKDLVSAKEVRTQIISAINAGDTSKAYKLLEEQYIPLTDNIRLNIITVSDEATGDAQSAVDRGNKTTSTAVIVMILLIAGGVAIGITFSIVISNSIRKPVAEIERAASELSNGKLNSVITYKSTDELGSLAESMRITINGLSMVIKDQIYLMEEIAGGNFNSHSTCRDMYIGDFAPLLANIREMNNTLSDTLRQIRQSADQVSSGSDQVSTGAQALSQGATEQASAVEELAATINDVSQRIHNSAEYAEEANKKVDLVGSEVEESNRQMVQMTDAMTDINNSSQQISKIIKTIEDIALQTNILALNAAVEAARAGAAGKGFAVVAEEVRNLASKSAEASKNTAALIALSIQAVEHGTGIAQETAEALGRVVEGAREVTSVVNRISQSSVEQADAIAQITQGVDQISSVVQTNSATAEESAAASEELSAQAEVLKDLVDRFKLKDAENTATAGSRESHASENLHKAGNRNSHSEPKAYSVAYGSKY